MNKEERIQLFEKMPVHKAVFKQVVPAIVSQMIVLIYNLADTYFVGILNQPSQTAAITVAYPSFLMLTAISNLFGIGGASVIARSLGKKQTGYAREAASVAFWTGLIFACLFSFFFFLLARPVLFLCGAAASTYSIAFAYAKWVIIGGGPFVILNTLLANLVRSEGSSAFASIGVSLGGVINIFLDPLFILPQFLGRGAEGAGMATAISNFAATLYFLFYILYKKENTVLNIRPVRIRSAASHIKEIFASGLPSAFQYALTVVSLGAQARFVSKYTTEAVAALGIIKKIDQIPLYFSIGTANGLLPLLAYNYAAGNQPRRKQIFKLGSSVSVGFSLLCLLLFELYAPQLSSLFIDDPQTLRYCCIFLRIMVTAMPFMALCYPMIIQFQAIGKVRESMVISIMRKGALDIPLLFLLDSLFPLYGCMWVQPIVDLTSLTAALAITFSQRTPRSIIRRNVP